ncbi:MAG: DNA integrity scanning diadenylate cyclase DisA [Nanoarchaeota archaeon]
MEQIKDKKEIQKTIIGDSSLKEKVSDDEFFSVLRTIAPGTHIRTSLDGVVKAGKGAIIVEGNERIFSLIDGGFRLNARFTPQKLIELSKMDGAIILSKDMKKILLANVLLTPDNRISTNETGTRHKAAERVAKQAGTLVIAVSERKNEITLFYKNVRHPLIESGGLLRKANEHIQMLEKQRELFDKSLVNLNHLELRNYPSLSQAIVAIQKGRMVQKISSELKKYIIELGKEGVLLKIRLKEITSDVDSEVDLIIKDYTMTDMKKSKALLEDLSYDELIDAGFILKILDYNTSVQNAPIKGWRILSKTTLPAQDIAEIIKETGSLGKALYSNLEFHKAILGEEKAKMFKNEIENVKLTY